MAGEWRASTWGDEIILEYGKALRDYGENGGRFRVFGSNGPIGWTDTPLAAGPGVILGRKGAYRGVHYSADPFHVIDTAYYVVPRQGADMRWLYYAIKAHKLGEIDDGSPIPSTTRSAVYIQDLDVPSVEEQKRIAQILGALDDKIELNRKTSGTLEAMARALFKSWFVDFGHRLAKVEAETAGLTEQTDVLFSDQRDNPEAGEILAGFSVVRIGDLVELIRDQEDPSGSPDSIFHHFSLPAFDEGQAPRLELGSTIKSNKWRVPRDAVLLSKLNPEIERVWLPSVAPGDRAVCSTEFLVLRAKSTVTPSFLYCLLRSPLFRTQIEGLVTGTSKSHQRAQVDSILDLPVVRPLPRVLELFDRQAAPWLARSEVCRNEAAALRRLRGALLPVLLSGEKLTVPSGVSG